MVTQYPIWWTELQRQPKIDTPKNAAFPQNSKHILRMGYDIFRKKTNTIQNSDCLFQTEIEA